MIPKSVNNKLDRIYKIFLWGSMDERRKLHPVSWDVVTRSKVEGGLGLKRSEDKNQALVGSLAWRAVTSKRPRPWAVELRRKYGRGLNLRRGCVVNKKALKEGSRLCVTGSIWAIGEGKEVKVWSDTWIGQHPLRRIIHGPLTPRDEKQTVVELLDENGEWWWDNLGYNLPNEIKERAIGLPRALYEGIEDRVVWGHEPSGHYSTRSALNLIREPKGGRLRRLELALENTNITSHTSVPLAMLPWKSFHEYFPQR